MVLKLLKFLGTPFLAVGFLWYALVETPFYQGRLLAFSKLLSLVSDKYPEEEPKE